MALIETHDYIDDVIDETDEIHLLIEKQQVDESDDADAVHLDETAEVDALEVLMFEVFVDEVDDELDELLIEWIDDLEYVDIDDDEVEVLIQIYVEYEVDDDEIDDINQTLVLQVIHVQDDVVELHVEVDDEVAEQDEAHLVLDVSDDEVVNID